MISKIDELKKQYNEISLQIKFLDTQRRSIKNDIHNTILKEHLYETDSTKYAGKYLKELSLIIDNGSSIEIEYFINVDVDDDGHFRAYEWGEMSHSGYYWSDLKNSYVTDNCFDDNNEPVKIIGFFDVKVEE